MQFYLADYFHGSSSLSMSCILNKAPRDRRHDQQEKLPEIGEGPSFPAKGIK